MVGESNNSTDPQITVEIDHTTIGENDGSNAAIGTVTRSNMDNSDALTVYLKSDDTSEVTIPASVVIPAGQDSVTFAVDGIDDSEVDGNQHVTITATAAIPGSLEFDATYGGNGIAKSTMFIEDSILQEDGKLLNVGFFWKFDANGDRLDNDIVVSRFLENGQLDTSFGSAGTGEVLLDLVGRNENAFTIDLQSDGKIVVGGEIFTAGIDSQFDRAAFVLRLDANGVLDTTFGDNGITQIDTTNAGEVIHELVIRDDDTIVAAGAKGTSSAVLYQFDSDGATINFSEDSEVLFLGSGFSVGTALKMLPDGKFIVGARYRDYTGPNSNSGTDFGMVRFTSDLQFDTTFGEDGRVITIVPGTNSWIYDLAVQSDGKVLAVGHAQTSRFNMTLARYDTDGSLDATFGTNGLVVTQLPESTIAYAVHSLADNSFLIAQRYDGDIPGKTEFQGLLNHFTSSGELIEGNLRVLEGNGFSINENEHGEIFVSNKLSGEAGVQKLSAACFVQATTQLTVIDDENLATPIAVDDSYLVDEDQVLSVDASAGVLSNDTDADGDTLTTTLVSSPANGTLTLNSNGSFTYTPNPDFSGIDTFTYTAGDGATNSFPATVSITVNGINDAPVAVSESYTTPEETRLIIDAPGLLANDTDADGDTLSSRLISEASNGNLRVNINGMIDYIPNNGFVGTDSFTYVASDGTVDSAITTVTIHVTAVNKAPVANDDNYSIDEDNTLTVSGATSLGVLDNDSDPDQDPLTSVLNSGPSNGTLTFNANGTFEYTPDLNFNGTDSFSYQAFDGEFYSNIATVTINVNPVNDAPVAADDRLSLNEGSILQVAPFVLLSDDMDVDGDPLSIVITQQPAFGSVVVNADGSLTYTSDPDYNGNVSFKYRASDGSLLSNEATVDVTIFPRNDAPVADNDQVSLGEDTSLQITTESLTANDSDVDGDPLSVVITQQPTHGTLTANADGSFSYTPDENYHGTDSFSYRASDGELESNEATVAITVNSVNDAPTVTDGTFTIAENSGVETNVGTVVSNDIENDTLTYEITSGNELGAFEIDQNGVISVANSAPLDFETNPTFTLTVQVTDSNGGTGQATITINLTDVEEIIPATISGPTIINIAKDKSFDIIISSTNELDVRLIDINSLNVTLMTGETFELKRNKKGVPRISYSDTNGDGIADQLRATFVVNGQLPEIGLNSLTITGLVDGEEFSGTDEVTIETRSNKGKGKGNGKNK